jgi:hypothetical protein
VSRLVQARLDEETDSLRAKLQKQLGWSNSRIVREGIKLLSAVTPTTRKRRFSGAGKYESGLPDLATNPKYLDDFGKSWRCLSIQVR